MEAGKDQQSYGHVKFEVHIRLSSGHVKQAVGRMDLKFTEGDWAGDEHFTF